MTQYARNSSGCAVDDFLHQRVAALDVAGQGRMMRADDPPHSAPLQPVPHAIEGRRRQITAVKRADVPVHVDDGATRRMSFFEIFLRDRRRVHARFASASKPVQVLAGDRLPLGIGDLGMGQGEHCRAAGIVRDIPSRRRSREAE